MKRFFTLFTLICTFQLFAQDITTLPHFEGFEGTTGTLHENYPSGWTSEDLNTVQFGNQTWQIIKNAPSSVNAHTDSSSIHMWSHMTENNDDWLFTPSIQMTGGATYKLSFWYAAKVVSGSSEKLAVYAGSTNTAAAMSATTELWKNESIDNDFWSQLIIPFTPTTDGNYYFAFHYYSDMFNFILMIDDVTILESGVGMEENEAPSYRMLGNPVQNHIHVEFTSPVATSAQAQLLAMDGTLVAQKTLEAQSKSLRWEVADLAKGVYFLHIQSEGFIIREKIIIQ